MMLKHEIYLKDLFDNNIGAKIEHLKVISLRAHEQRSLRVKAES